jgi:transposase
MRHAYWPLSGRNSTYPDVQISRASSLYASIKACTHTVGRTPIDPRLLLALWLYAVIDGVGSAREIVRLCQRDLVYRWLCGGVSQRVA